MHTALTDISADILAQKSNFITGIDARIKIAFVFVALLLNILISNIWTSLTFTICGLIALLIIKIPFRLMILRLAMPLFMAFIVAITQLFLFGTTPLFTVPGLPLTGYTEGLSQGILIMWRVIGGGVLVIFLSLSTPAHKLFRAAGWFKIPHLFIELCLLVYRYIFVLLDELVTMRDAQKVRLGYHTFKRSLNSTVDLGGNLILRAYSRAERVYEAMIIRGYTGENRTLYWEKLQKSDFLAITGFVLILALSLVGKLV
jgi:cobalt/nickel transport system permease protein